MTKYRVRLRNGRVVGPFEKHQLFELKTKAHIDGSEDAQVFPTGDWKPFKTFDFYSELMDENRTEMVAKEKEEMTFVIDLAKLRAKKTEEEVEKNDITKHKPVKELTETVRITTAPVKRPKVDIELDQSPPRNDHTLGLELQIADEMSKSFDIGERTIINPVAQQEIEKMRRREKAEQQKTEEEKDRKKRENEALRQLIPVEETSTPDGATQVFKLDNLLPSTIIQDAVEEEIKIELEAKAYRKKKRAEESANDEEDEDDEALEEEHAKKKKKKIMIAVGIGVLLYALLFPSDEKPKKPPFSHLDPQIQFPIPFDQADKKNSEVRINKANELFSIGDYKSIVLAGLLYKEAFENDLENSLALNMMVRAYAEQLPFSRDKQKDSLTLFNIIQSKRPFLAKDPNGVIGMNLFYTAIKKNEAAADIVAKYLKLNSTNVTPDLFAAYLQTLMKLGRIDTSKQFYQALVKTPDKNRYTLNALADYATLNEETKEATGYVDEGLKKFPKLVNFLLRKSDILIKEKKYKEARPYLEKAEELSLEYNDHYRALFLQNSGILLAFVGKTELATKFLKLSLKVEDSVELRMRLADLNTTESKDETSNLIEESKAIKYLVLAKDFFEKRNYELALSNASKASDLYPGHIPSELFLAKVQMRLGLAQQSINTLEALRTKYSDSRDVNLALIEAYIDTYKFNQAKNRIATISNSEEIKGTAEFASVNAQLYIRMGDPLQAISWLQNSISTNPLNDRDIYLLADLLIKRSNFEAAKTLLNKCMELDPIEPDYRIAFARIIYETQDDQAAIGYLLGLLDEFHDNAKILSEIAIFYYRAGKVKDFEAFKQRIEKLPYRDKSLYEFLVRAALLDERYAEIPPLVNQLLSIEPGALDAMMTAGKVLFETGKLVEAAHWFKRIQDKLDTYPKVQYYIAKIMFLSKDYVGATEEIQKDLKANGENDASLALLAEVYIENNNLVEAEKYFKKAQKLNPKSYEALIGLADISTKRNNYDLALDLYKKAMVQKGDEPVIHKKIGDVYRLLGQGSLAIESYKLYLEMNPEASDKGQIQSYINLMQ